MSIFNGKFESVKQEWETPKYLFDKLHAEFDFQIDLAADKTNHKVEKYYTADDDALTKEWDTTAWLNPPYGLNKGYRLEKWIEKAYYDSVKYDTTVVLLIPVRTNTKYWSAFCMKAKEIRFIDHRVKFGTAIHGLPQPLALVVFARTDKEPVFSMYGFE